MAKEKMALNEDEALELLAYTLSSAQRLLEEPPDYGILRMVTAAERLARAWAPRADEALAAYLGELASRMPTEVAQMDVDLDAFAEYLGSQIRSLAEEVKGRGSAQ